MPTMSVTFSDIAAMLQARPPLASKAPCALVKNIETLQSAAVELAPEWQDLVARLAQIQQKNWPQIKHPRLALYASNYGGDILSLQQRLQHLNTQNDVLTRLCAMLNADLRVYELDLATDISTMVLDEVQACHAISYGLMSVEEHVDCLIVETLSSGVDSVLQRWEQMLRDQPRENPLVLLLQAGGGHDLFAVLGAVLAARMAKVPVFGTQRLDAVLPVVLQRLMPDADSVYLVLPRTLTAADVVPTMAALQQLQFILALGPVASNRTVLPQAA